MSTHFKNFKTVVYIPAWVADHLDRDRLKTDYAFLEKYIGLDKVYLETHRDGLDIPKEQLLMIKGFLEEKGVSVSGGITTTINDFEGAEAGKRRIFNTFCYTDPAMRRRIKEISEYTAGIFDEVILDDFFFTNCSCERCLEAKGDRSWPEFRRELMKDVSQNLIVAPAKAVNPKVRMIIKYPNWRESVHHTGYLPELQDGIFDATYIGTETRSPAYTDQHLPEYLSYALPRFMENAWPGRCGGGWFDTYQCWSADRYLEQAYLTAFAQEKEIMHFMWGDLIDNPFVCAMGLQLGKIDRMMDGFGKAKGVPVYIPHASGGENHFEMRLGMCGLPLEPTPVFPEDAPRMLLTETALGDADIIERLEQYVRKGGDAVITSGFLAKAGEELRKRGLTECCVSDKKLAVSRYMLTSDFAGNIGGNFSGQAPLLFPAITHATNDSWTLVNGGDGELHEGLFLRSSYGKGRLYILAVPENEADLYRIPDAVLDVVKRSLLSDGNDSYASGRQLSLFTYEDGSMILYRYVKPELHSEHVTLHTRKKVSALVDTASGRRIPVQEKRFFEDFTPVTEYTAELIATPGRFTAYRWEE
ncbi:MAG: hypothetical protein IKO11_01930 [Lachnospiraceae bacterium]|nr:hypothetical protein [Lachnospiraceae bacterium]